MTLDLTRLTDTVDELSYAIHEDFDGDETAKVADAAIIVEIVTESEGVRTRHVRIRSPKDMRHHALRGLLDEASGIVVFRRHGPDAARRRSEPGPDVS